jgi:hypothetical protein
MGTGIDSLQEKDNDKTLKTKDNSKKIKDCFAPLAMTVQAIKFGYNYETRSDKRETRNQKLNE